MSPGWSQRLLRTALPWELGGPARNSQGDLGKSQASASVSVTTNVPSSPCICEPAVTILIALPLAASPLGQGRTAMEEMATASALRWPAPFAQAQQPGQGLDAPIPGAGRGFLPQEGLQQTFRHLLIPELRSVSAPCRRGRSHLCGRPCDCSVSRLRITASQGKQQTALYIRGAREAKSNKGWARDSERFRDAPGHTPGNPGLPECRAALPCCPEGTLLSCLVGAGHPRAWRLQANQAVACTQPS